MKKLNIALLNDSFPPILDGVSMCVYNYAKAMHQKYGKVIVATPQYPNAKDDYPFKVIRYPSIDAGEKIGYRIGNPLSAKTMIRIAKEKPDILHSHCPFTASMLARFTRQYTKRPIVFTYHTKFNIDIEKRVGLSGIQNASLKLILNNINASDEVWVVSKGAGDNLRELGYEGKYKLMENGTDFEKKRVPDEIVEKLRAHHSIGDDELVFLFVGRMQWYKNVGFTIDALSEIKKQGYKFKMIFVGEGQDRIEIEQYSRSKGLADSAIFTGAIHDREILREYFCLADLFLFPSTYDTNGLVVREASACDLASIVIRDSCAAESIIDPMSGILIENSLESYINALKDAFQNKERLKTMGRIAGERIYLSWDDAVKRAAERYHYIIEAHRLNNL